MAGGTRPTELMNPSRVAALNSERWFHERRECFHLSRSLVTSRLSHRTISFPVDDHPFKWAHQPGLENAYRSINAPQLPFSFSYHWRGGKSNAMIARRMAVHASATEVPVSATAR